MYYLLILLLLLPNLSVASAWSKEDKLRETAVITVLTIDMLQTLEIKHTSNIEETNIFLGSNPSEIKITTYFLTIITSHIIIADLLGGYKKYWQYGILIPELYIVGHNYNLGLRCSF